MLDGIIAALRDAERDLGIQSRVIPAINRELGPALASEFLEVVLADRRPEVIGIGLDYNEVDHPAAAFAGIYHRAKNAGLHATAHAAENGPSQNVGESLDLLGCDRIDHGYHVVDDPALFRADLAREYLLLSQHMGFTQQQLGEAALNSLRASWLDETTKRSWTAEWRAETDRLLNELQRQARQATP